jgi:hypothetical protein
MSRVFVAATCADILATAITLAAMRSQRAT